MNNYKAAAAASILTVLSVMVSLSAGASCDENGQCKYGGWCDKLTNTCTCSFKCSKDLWGIEYHCHRNENGRVSYFANLCLVRTKACERQKEVPVMKIDFKNPNWKKCKEDFEEAPLKLCTQAEDFYGRCGSTAGRYGNIRAGICLQGKENGSKQCRCPSDKFGLNCESRKIRVRSVAGEPDEKDFEQFIPKEETDKQIKMGIFVAAILFALVVCAAVVAHRYIVRNKGPQNRDTTDQNHATDPYSDVTIPIESEAKASPTQQRQLAHNIRDLQPSNSRYEVYVPIQHKADKATESTALSNNNNC